MRAESGYAEYPFIRAATADELSLQCRHLVHQPAAPAIIDEREVWQQRHHELHLSNLLLARHEVSCARRRSRA